MARGGRGRILEAETEREKNLTQRRGGRGVEAEEERKKGGFTTEDAESIEIGREMVVDDLKILQKTERLHEGRWWEPVEGGRVHCYLCPRHCRIGDGQAGFCFIRVNRGGTLYSLGYGAPAALQVDPIEKKPLNHFLPGTRVFSMGTAGCNMGC